MQLITKRCVCSMSGQNTLSGRGIALTDTNCIGHFHNRFSEKETKQFINEHPSTTLPLLTFKPGVQFGPNPSWISELFLPSYWRRELTCTIHTVYSKQVCLQHSNCQSQLWPYTASLWFRYNIARHICMCTAKPLLLSLVAHQTDIEKQMTTKQTGYGMHTLAKIWSVPGPTRFRCNVSLDPLQKIWMCPFLLLLHAGWKDTLIGVPWHSRRHTSQIIKQCSVTQYSIKKKQYTNLVSSFKIHSVTIYRLINPYDQVLFTSSPKEKKIQMFQSLHLHFIRFTE